MPTRWAPDSTARLAVPLWVSGKDRLDLVPVTLDCNRHRNQEADDRGHDRASGRRVDVRHRCCRQEDNSKNYQ